ncbi:MerR family transcriptional regulator [Rhodococcus sp. SGAir0479]|uniref:MerR family transcriptional regulator n=1 Tax=Rhodococcus sp. SGAir0479 TaxID=2567884 RepID=UPI0010CD6A8A|nr:MerR family transcriptional regulator [Rhodococcus sp. SGAir0479]QCQ92371.1 MerR family transcriptional regulator [Rhodococcus sp. SGAir0479]
MKEYRIDDLAREAGVSVRNVRVYQDRGLLPPPRKEGRAGWYNESHLARLNLIGRMLDRGYTFATISELLTAAQYGLHVRDVLETDDPGGRWKKYRRAAKLTLSELRRMFGDQTTEADIALGTRLGVLAKAGTEYSVTNPRLIEAAQVLVDAGIPLADILEKTESARRDLGAVAASFVELVSDRYLAREGETLELDEATISEVAAVVNQVRPLAYDAVHALFAEAVEEQISKALAKAASQLEQAAPEADSPRAG